MFNRFCKWTWWTSDIRDFTVSVGVLDETSKGDGGLEGEVKSGVDEGVWCGLLGVAVREVATGSVKKNGGTGGDNVRGSGAVVDTSGTTSGGGFGGSIPSSIKIQEFQYNLTQIYKRRFELVKLNIFTKITNCIATCIAKFFRAFPKFEWNRTSLSWV